MTGTNEPNEPNPLASPLSDPLEAPTTDPNTIPDDVAAQVGQMAKDSVAGHSGAMDKILDGEGDTPDPETPEPEEPKTADPKQQTPEVPDSVREKLARLEELETLVGQIEGDSTLMGMIEDYYQERAGDAEPETPTPEQPATDPTVQTLQQQVAEMKAALQVESFFNTRPEARELRSVMAEISTKNPGIQDLDLLFKLARTQQGEGQQRALNTSEQGSATPRRDSGTVTQDLTKQVEKVDTNNLGELGARVAAELFRKGQD